MNKTTVKISLNIGGKRTKFSALDTQSTGNMVNDFLKDMLSKVAGDLQINLGKMAKNLPKVIENSYTDAVLFAARKMVGTPVARGAKNRTEAQFRIDDQKRADQQPIKGPEGETIAYWQVLTPRSIREQNAINGASTSGHFMVRRGELRRDLLGMARTYVKNTGVVKVKFSGQLRDARGRFTTAGNVKNKIVNMGDFSIQLMPNISSGMLPGLRRSNPLLHDPDLAFERKLGFSSAALEKLRGATNNGFLIPGTHRPLMQPVFTYWTLNRIPQVIARSIAGSIPRAKKIDNSSGQSFGIAT